MVVDVIMQEVGVGRAHVGFKNVSLETSRGISADSVACFAELLLLWLGWFPLIWRTACWCSEGSNKFDDNFWLVPEASPTPGDLEPKSESESYTFQLVSISLNHQNPASFKSFK